MNRANSALRSSAESGRGTHCARFPGIASRALLGVFAGISAFLVGASAHAEVVIGAHVARFDATGGLVAWTAWSDALDREMRFYREAPLEHGYPRFVTQTFLGAAWASDPTRRDTIPATQNAMGIISYLKFYVWRGKRDARDFETAQAMGDYLVRETLTPASGSYPRFPRSSGLRGQFPLAADAGSQADHAYEIEPDKGGLVGFALVQLFEGSTQHRFLDHAVHIARVLASHQRAGDDRHSPWPFRVDYRDGRARGDVSGNTVYILRLFDALIAHGYREFDAPRRSLWRWIKQHQILSAKGDGALFAQFFEDHDSPANRTAWAPLNLARYLLQRRAALDPDWRADAGILVDFVRAHFTHEESGVTVCHEQDEDHDAWGGINATYGAVLALYAQAIDSPALAREARQALNFTLYAIDDQGHPRDLPRHTTPGGWQEDAHTDVIHNYIDAMTAFPTWATSQDE